MAWVISLLTIPKSSYGIDSIYVKFIHKKIDIQQYGYCTTFSLGRKLYLFVKEKNDSTIKCFIIRQNKNIAFGRLNIKNVNSIKMAVREGYWRVKNGTGFMKTYYHDDDKIKPDDFPLEK